MKKFIKYILCFITVLGIFLSFCACETNDKDDKKSKDDFTVKEYMIGRYELTKIQWEDGVTVSGKILQQTEETMGDMYVELFSDKTAQLSLYGQVHDMEFSEDKMWQINYEYNSYDFLVENGQVTLIQDDDTYTFIKK